MGQPGHNEGLKPPRWLQITEGILAVYIVVCTVYLVIVPLIAEATTSVTPTDKWAALGVAIGCVTMGLVAIQIWIARRQIEVAREIATRQNTLIEEQIKIANTELDLVTRQMRLLERHERANLALYFGRESPDREGSKGMTIMGIYDDEMNLSLQVFNDGKTITNAVIELFIATPTRNVTGMFMVVPDHNWKGNFSTYTERLHGMNQNCVRFYHQSTATFFEKQPLDLPDIIVTLPKVTEAKRTYIYWRIRCADGIYPSDDSFGELMVSVSKTYRF